MSAEPTGGVESQLTHPQAVGSGIADLDKELCLCFHVTQRKVVSFLRVERPQRASQLAECFGAGTGCGWCRPFLQRLFERAVAGGELAITLPTPEEYARLRARYIRQGGGVPPPGAAPLPDDVPDENEKPRDRT
jgi:bacterioferritin-associated ferredoxin